MIILDPKLWKEVSKTWCRSESGGVRDVLDGQKYKEMQFASRQTLTMVVNTDGVQLFKSSQVSMWPIWIVVNEFPASMRYYLGAE